MWLSLVEHTVRDRGVAGSNPVTPTISIQPFALEPFAREHFPDVVSDTMALELNLGVLILSSAAAYLCGSIPTGVLIANRQGIAVSEAGSGNMGATNVARMAGKKAGILTLVGDVLKGLLPVLIVRWLSLGEIVQASTAVMALLGHLFPVFLRFSGGKGVATGLGVFLGLTPAAILTALLGFAIVVAATRLVSLASLSAAALTPFLIFFSSYPRSHSIAGIIIAVLIIFRHHENISRLMRGEEQKFRLRNSSPSA